MSLSFLPIHLSNGRVLRVEIKKSKRAKRFWLRADISGIYLVTPAGNFKIHQAINFLDSKKPWVLKAIQYYERIRTECDTDNIQRDTISFLGKRYSLQIVKDRTSSVTMSNNLSKITFHVTDVRHYKHDIKQWYFKETRRIVAERLEFIRRVNPTIPANNKVFVKNHGSRWASCSEKRNLNFSLLLSALPIEAIDYVIIHELAHLIELNHSKRFWDIVKEIDPEFQIHRKLLHRYSILIKYTQTS